MDNLQIPIYRAKKIDSDDYIQGYLICENTGYFIQNHIGNGFKIIDPSTLAIHFPNWICIDQEAEREVKVFASLSEDKKGGSILEIRDNFIGATGALYFKEASLMFQGMHFTEAELQDFEVTGIQK